MKKYGIKLFPRDGKSLEKQDLEVGFNISWIKIALNLVVQKYWNCYSNGPGKTVMDQVPTSNGPPLKYIA